VSDSGHEASRARAVRLQRYLAEAGFGSRRACELLIREGRVAVGGADAEIGCTVIPGVDHVTVDGRTVAAERKEYWLLHKPIGVVSTSKDTHGRRTVVDVVPARGRVFPVGRLDMDTTGVLVLTNDGSLAHALLHPSREVTKEYEARVSGRVTARERERLQSGVQLEDGPTLPAEVEVLRQSHDECRVRLRLREGRKRQVRRMLKAVGHEVISLHRTRFGPLGIEGLPPGGCRELSDEEIRSLWEAAGAAPEEAFHV